MTDFVVGGRYNWKGQPERLTYMGTNRDGSGLWHQFAKFDAPGEVWCEVRPTELHNFEATPPMTTQPPAGDAELIASLREVAPGGESWCSIAADRLAALRVELAAVNDKAGDLHGEIADWNKAWLAMLTRAEKAEAELAAVRVDAEIFLNERDRERARADHIFKTLMNIYNVLSPPVINLPDGRVFVWSHPETEHKMGKHE
jgi:hypothetical protein